MKQGSTFSKAQKTLSLIMKKGPISLLDIQTELNLTRSTAHRLIQDLEIADWVHKTLNGSGYVVSHNLYKSICHSHIGNPETANIKQLIQKLSFRQNYHIDICILDQDGKCILSDSTQKKKQKKETFPLIKSVEGLTLLAAHPPKEKIKKISQYIQYSNDEDKKFVQSGQLAIHLTLDKTWGCSKCPEGTKVGIPIQFTDKTYGAMILRPKNARSVKFKTFEHMLEELWLSKFKQNYLKFPCFDHDKIIKHLKKKDIYETY